MKTIIGVILISFILFADSPKHNFTFTIEINGINLKQAAELEKEIIELIEGYENKSVKVGMEETKQLYEIELGDTLKLYDWQYKSPQYKFPQYYWDDMWKGWGKEYLKVDSLNNQRFVIPHSGSWFYIDTKY